MVVCSHTEYTHGAVPKVRSSPTPVLYAVCALLVPPPGDMHCSDTAPGLEKGSAGKTEQTALVSRAEGTHHKALYYAGDQETIA